MTPQSLRPLNQVLLMAKITKCFMSLEGVGYDFNPHNRNINYSMLRFFRGGLGTVRIRALIYIYIYMLYISALVRVLSRIPSSRRNLMKNTHKVLRFIYFIILQRS